MPEKVKIVLENYDNRVCCPGQTLNGRVKCFFKKKQKVRGILLKLTGKARTEFSLGTRKSKVSYEGKEVYFDQQYDLILGGENFYVEAGKHAYPFSYTLPQSLPSCFDFDEGGKGMVKYTIKVTVDRPSKRDYKDKLVLNVVPPIDLNLVPALKKLHCVSVDGEVGLIGKNPLNLRVTLPYTGFVEGQTMNVTITVINMSSVTAKFVKLKMIQDVKLKGYAVTNREGFQEVARVISEWQCDGVGEAHTEKTSTTALTIPKKSLPNIQACSVIHVAYRLEAKLIMPFPYSDIVANVPITIGTIPLSETDASQLQTSSYPATYNAPLTTSLSGRRSPFGSMGNIAHYPSAPPEIGFNMSVLPHFDAPQLSANGHSTLASGPTANPPDPNVYRLETKPTT